jgi:hypothetical protein
LRNKKYENSKGGKKNSHIATKKKFGRESPT